MKIKDVTEEHQYHSSRASESARVMAGAGIAFVWLLAGDRLEGLRDGWLLATVLFLVAALALDAAHYIVGAEKWDAFIAELEETRPPEQLKDESPVEISD